MQIDWLLIKKKVDSRYLLLSILLFLLFIYWFRGGFESVSLSYDFGRDLSEISNIYLRKTVWLGPQLIGYFPASSIYYYIFYPALWLSGGNGNSIIVANLLLAVISLGVFGILSIKKLGNIGLIIVAIIGLSPWWQINALTPGNGSTYVLWLFCALISLYFKGPLFISAIFCGLSIAYHPAAVFIIPILIYEWWMQKHSFKSLLLLLLGLIGPSFPTILFEFITKGFLTRDWLTHPSAGLLSIDKHINLFNIFQIGAMSGINSNIVIYLLFFVAFFIRKRERVWYFIILLPILVFCFFSPLAIRYLTGIVCTLWFIFIIFFSQSKWGKVILVLILLFYFGKYVVYAQPPEKMVRNIPRMSQIVNRLIDKNILDKNKKIAVIEAIDPGGLVPAADDYRFFLRMKKYNILDVQQYNKAEILIMFIEEPNFEWKKWSTWDIEQAACKRIIKVLEIDNIKIIIFGK